LNLFKTLSVLFPIVRNLKTISRCC